MVPGDIVVRPANCSLFPIGSDQFWAWTSYELALGSIGGVFGSIGGSSDFRIYMGPKLGLGPGPGPKLAPGLGPLGTNFGPGPGPYFGPMWVPLAPILGLGPGLGPILGPWAHVYTKIGTASD